ncbi:hypothetical protein Y032_0924g3057 [Ancylostoma ceylanicum]|uniref:Uncharacterized protein n=1 Tax=Ancylostoma ceylanicum TaxID=53326 RepID=A0A016WB15_9BILA|nr:hypothetical protein Y032_0924g3057 [Ancylostoma ceylanicum]
MSIPAAFLMHRFCSVIAIADIEILKFLNILRVFLIILLNNFSLAFRGVIGRTFSTALGLATMAAFCYPHETVDVVRTGIAHSQMTWERFQQCGFLCGFYFSLNFIRCHDIFR